jgi:hypothetical protein
MLSVAIKAFQLTVILHNAIQLNAVAPFFVFWHFLQENCVALLLSMNRIIEFFQLSPPWGRHDIQHNDI